MRTIKFRAWKKTQKKMSYSDNWSGYDWELVSGEDDRFIIMQYTGLKSKSGKEIYEGDKIEGFLSNVRVKGVVVFEQGIFGINAPDFCLLKRLVVEIIGNVWENKDLLGGK